MPSVILPPSFLALLQRLRPAFSDASFDNFVVLIAGFVHALGGHRLTDALRAAGATATKHHSSYYRFLSHAQWSLDHLGLLLVKLIIATMGLLELQLVLDDTLARRTGKNVALAGMHKDPLLKGYDGKPFMSYGHVFVVVSVYIRVPWLADTGWALPVLFRLFEPPKQGGRGDAPSDVRRAADRRRKGKAVRQRPRRTDRTIVDGELRQCDDCVDTGPLPDELRPKKTELAAQMLLLIAQHLPNMPIIVAADHLYNGRSVLYEVVGQCTNVTIIARGRPDAALYELPPARTGKVGRPRVKGERLPNPQAWAAANEEAFQPRTVHIYGRAVPVEVASYTAMSYQSLPGRLLRYVIVRDPAGLYKTAYLLCTDPQMDEVEIIERYARRWPLERTFQDCKQLLCVENTQTQLPAAVRRSVPLGMMLYSLIVLWYVTEGHTVGESGRLADDPWYRRTARPSFTEMRAVLRRSGWASTNCERSWNGPCPQKLWESYLARVVAAA